MKKIIVLFFLLISPVSNAEELKVIFSMASCQGKNKFGYYEYKFGLIVKNISNQNQIIVTKPSSVGSLRFENRVREAILIEGGGRSYEGVSLIFPKEDLGLVELYPGEGAEVYGSIKLGKSNSFGDEVVVGYQLDEIDGGRYKNWQGQIKGEPVKIENAEKCISSSKK